jgi:nicotinamidase-related amidase
MPQKSGRPIPVAGTALLLIDVLSHFRFPDGAAVLRGLRRNLPALTRLVSRSRRAGVPLIYVNDNLGKWRSDQAEILAICFQARAMGRDVVRALSPGPSDNFVLKPRRTAASG